VIATVHEEPQRVEEFKAEVAALRIKDPSTTRDRLVAKVGLAAMAVGVALPIAAYSLSHGTTNALQQRDAIVLALLGVAVATCGVGLYLKAALSGFLRFWLLREIHERRAQTDRVLEALGQPAGVRHAGDEPGL
jgi:uncharacterized membrane protein YcjF (UPF0283 family)